MELNGTEYNFGRRVFVTFIPSDKVAVETIGLVRDDLSKYGVTVAYDPTSDVNLCTRIDFSVRHVDGSFSPLTPGYTTCDIDLYNLGPEIRQIFDAYNTEFVGNQDRDKKRPKYAVVLRVGYRDQTLITLFSGYVGSWNVERIQTASTVDEVWHLYAQYPTPYQTNLKSEKAQSGVDYALEGQWLVRDSLTTPESYLRSLIMCIPRWVYERGSYLRISQSNSYKLQYGEPEKIGRYVLDAPVEKDITPTNFDKYFQIRYVKAGMRGQVDEELLQEWRATSNYRPTPVNFQDVGTAVRRVAASRNCMGFLEVDFKTGKQIITIIRYRDSDIYKGYRTDKYNWVITNFQNLRKSPQVSAGRIEFDLMMEPDMRVMDTIELTLTDNFKKVPSFQMTWDNGKYAQTAFAGSDILSLSHTSGGDPKVGAMAGYGNIFNQRYYIQYIEHTGSTHTSDWYTKAQCEGIDVNATGEGK